MKIYHIVEDYSRTGGGIRTVVKDLTTHIPFDSNVLTLRKEKEDVDVEVFNSIKQWNYSKHLSNYLDKLNIGNAIYHIHGVWMHTQYIASKIAKKKNIPFVLTPHGMYEPWLWKQGYIKKNIYYDFVIKKHFNKANIIHAITEEEKNNLYKLFSKKTRIEVIPNLISSSIIPQIKESYIKEKYILFLGRIHSKKGIKLLIETFYLLQQSKFKLKIAGGNSEHKKELIEYVNKLSIANQVEFVGEVTGERKFELYKNAHVFVAPSYSEVIGMVNLEAAIMETPVITTHQTGLYKGWDNEGGILINPYIEELKKALKKALSWNERERNERGKRLKEFVLKNYSWERNINKWEDLYKSIL